MTLSTRSNKPRSRGGRRRKSTQQVDDPSLQATPDAAAASNQSSNTGTAGETPVALVAAPGARPPRRSGRRPRGGGRRGRGRQAGETVDAAAAPAPIGQASEPASTGPTRIEKESGEVVIRFPSVGTPRPRPAAPPDDRPDATREAHQPGPAVPMTEGSAERYSPLTAAQPPEVTPGSDGAGSPVVEINTPDWLQPEPENFAAEEALSLVAEVRGTDSEAQPPAATGSPMGARVAGDEAGGRGGRRRRRRRRRRGGREEGPVSVEPSGSEMARRPDEAGPELQVVEREVAEPAGQREVFEGESADDRRGRRRHRRGRRRGRGDRRDESVAAPASGDYDEPDLELIDTAPEEARPEEDSHEPIDSMELDESALAPSIAPKWSEVAHVKARKEMIINVAQREECRIGILKDSKLEEIYLERASAENHVGNIYKGLVTNVEPSIQAAFVDFGLGKNGFLHISDLHPMYFPNGEGQTEDVGRKLPRRKRPPIQRCLRRGQSIVVQITKEGIGTKGPTLTTYLSIPGRYLVMMPGMRRLGVSRKIEDEDTRRKLRAQLNELQLPDDVGFIARTAAQGRTKRELQSDLNYLTRLWRAAERRIKNERAPAELYRESDLVIRTIRDVFTTDVERIVVDDHEMVQRARQFLAIFSPRSRDVIVEYDSNEPVFHRYGIEAELERLHSRHAPLPAGGSLVIDQTEALVAIDVNSGRFRTEDDAEQTAFKINMEAADEIARQLRLRDLGGVIICDFIDMRQEKHRREVEKRLIKNLKEHKERAKVLRMSQFGIIELTRQRQRASLTRSVYQDCHHCRGTGLVKTAESVALDVMRLIQLAVTRENISLIEVLVSSEVADMLQNRKRAALHALEAQNRRTISIRPQPGYGLDQVQVQCFDSRGRLVPHP
jgi:ribonuclease E